MNDISDEAGVAAGARAGPPGARQGRWIQAALAVLAVAAGAVGAVAGATALAEDAPWGSRAALAAGWLGGAAALAALLWAAGWTLRRQELLLRRQQRILDLVSAQLFPTILEVTDAVPVVSAPADAGPVDRPQPSAEISPSRVTHLLERVLTELAQIQADMLLTPEQMEARREERRRQEVQAAQEMIEQALEAGHVDRAEKMVDSYRRALPNSSHAEDYRRRLADLLAEQAEGALRSGDLPAAEHAMRLLAEKYGGQDRAAKLRDRVVGRLAEDIERALLQDDLAGAGGMLAEFDRRFPHDPRARGLHARLVAARQAVQADEVRSHRRRIEELMALARFDQAEVEAGELAGRHPELAEARHLLETVQREAAAFRAERRSRLYAQIKRFADAKQWRHALDTAQRLVAAHPECPEAKEADAMMSTLRENAKIEQVREMRDRLTDMVRRRRFAEALEIARDVIDQFPDSQAAIELQSQLPRLVELAASGQGHAR